MKAVVSYYLLACALSWIVWLPLCLHHAGFGSVPDVPLLHPLGSLGPGVAAILMTHCTEGRTGVAALFRAMAWARPLRWVFVALLSPFLLLALALAAAYFTGAPVSLGTIGNAAGFPYLNGAFFFIYNMIFFGYGEETGWKGFMLPRLQQRFSALTSSLFFTAFWAAWHIPLFFFRPGYMSMDAAGAAGWLFSLLTGSVLLTWLFNSSGGSILACAVFHAAIDVAFLSDGTETDVTTYLGAGITIWGILTVVVFGAAHLSQKPKVTDLGAVRKNNAVEPT